MESVSGIIAFIGTLFVLVVSKILDKMVENKSLIALDKIQKIDAIVNKSSSKSDADAKFINFSKIQKSLFLQEERNSYTKRWFISLVSGVTVASFWFTYFYSFDVRVTYNVLLARKLEYFVSTAIFLDYCIPISIALIFIYIGLRGALPLVEFIASLFPSYKDESFTYKIDPKTNRGIINDGFSYLIVKIICSFLFCIIITYSFSDLIFSLFEYIDSIIITYVSYDLSAAFHSSFTISEISQAGVLGLRYIPLALCISYTYLIVREIYFYVTNKKKPVLSF